MIRITYKNLSRVFSSLRRAGYPVELSTSDYWPGFYEEHNIRNTRESCLGFVVVDRIFKPSKIFYEDYNVAQSAACHESRVASDLRSVRKIVSQQ